MFPVIIALSPPPQDHLAASTVTFTTRTVSGQLEHEGKAEPKSTAGARPGRGLCSQGCPLLVGEALGGCLWGSACCVHSSLQ